MQHADDNYRQINSDRLLEQRGEFPARIKFGERNIVWLESEVDSYIDAKLAKRDAA